MLSFLMPHVGLWSKISFQILSVRVVIRLRALVVLPTRDLVAQVRETFEAVAKGRGLKVIAILKVCVLHLLSYTDWHCYRATLIRP